MVRNRKPKRAGAAMAQALGPQHRPRPLALKFVLLDSGEQVLSTDS